MWKKIVKFLKGITHNGDDPSSKKTAGWISLGTILYEFIHKNATIPQMVDMTPMAIGLVLVFWGLNTVDNLKPKPKVPDDQPDSTQPTS